MADNYTVEAEQTEAEKAEAIRLEGLLTQYSVDLIKKALDLYETVHNQQNMFDNRKFDTAEMAARGGDFEAFKAAHAAKMNHRKIHIDMENDLYFARYKIEQTFKNQQEAEKLRQQVTE